MKYLAQDLLRDFPERVTRLTIGYSLLARPFSKRFLTLSAWGNEDALRTFVQYPPHVRILTALAPHMGKTEFVRWTVKGSELPLKWDDALRRILLKSDR